MYRFMNVSGQGQAERSKNYDGFPGKVIVVDLATVNGETEKFEGRDWLDGITRENKPVGWDLEWQPDRTKETDNPIALMQFADESIALLLRTHKTRSWLPLSVMRALMSENCKKVQVGWDGPDRQKMQNTFNFHPLGIVDMSELAKVKGVAAQGLKSLSEHFGMKMQKDPKIARSNWAGMQLTKEQEQYAAEDAYFSFMLYQKLTLLPDAPLDRDHDQFNQIVNKGVLELRPGWEEQGIARRHDGLWCTMCNQGPMTVAEVVAKHMEGAKHKKRWELREGLGASADGHFPDLPDKYTSQHMIQGDGCNGLKPGEFKCTLCNAGPFNALATVDAHLRSKRHTGRMAPAEPQEQTDLPAEYTSQHIIQGDGCNGLKPGEFKCTLCNAGPFNALVTADAHIKSKKHTQRMTPAEPQEQTDLPDEYTSQCIIQGDGCNDLKPGEFRCTLCNAGPFNALATVDAHLKSKKHTGRMAPAEPQEQTDLPAEYTSQHIIQGDGCNGLKPGEFKCTLCNAGPFNALVTADAHIKSKKHTQRMTPAEPQEQTDLPDEYTSQCIIQGDGCNDLKPGEFRCTLCSAGPFNALVTVDEHLKSKKHTQRMATADPQKQTGESAKKDPLEGKEWNLPDYVTIASGALECTLCPAKANAYKTMAMHLGGDKHAKKCRGSGDSEIMWVQERQQLEVIETGKPVVRRGFKKPREGEARAAQTAEAVQQGAGAAGTGPLPEGWEEFTDLASGHVYYHHAAQGVSQWERPATAAQDSQRPPQQAQATEQGEASAIAQEAAQGASAGEPGPEAAAEPGPEALLPPGWHAVWSEESGAHYYADAETQVSQWDKPPPYVALDWARRSDPEGRAFWACREFSFYETDAAWQRFSDSENRIYWSSPTLQQRFFEPGIVSS